MTDNLSLFPNVDNAVFKTALERYGVWPTTVWNCNLTDRMTQKLKGMISDWGEARSGDNDRVYFAGTYRNVGTTDIYTGRGLGVFNPAVAAWILNCYAPGYGLCVDPFAGGGTRAIMALNHGLEYKGMEIRQVEVDATIERIENNCDNAKYDIYCDSAEVMSEYIQSNTGDFLITCPPYYDLERYEGGHNDLSMATDYVIFLDMIETIIKETYKILKSNAISTWVVGLHRETNGNLIPIHHDVTRLHLQNGFSM